MAAKEEKKLKPDNHSLLIQNIIQQPALYHIEVGILGGGGEMQGGSTVQQGALQHQRFIIVTPSHHVHQPTCSSLSADNVTICGTSEIRKLRC